MIRAGETLIFSFDGKDIRCRVEKIAKDASFLSIIEESNTLRMGKPFSMSIMRANGVEVGEGVVVKVRPPVVDEADKIAYANKLEYLIKVTRPFKRMQKRNAFRYECYIPVSLSNMNEPEIHKGHILDISAGGAKIYTDNRFIENKVINLVVTLGKEMHLFGVVLEINSTGGVSDYGYVMRIKFIDMTRGEEDAIIRYIFSEYRKSARKRKDGDD